MAGRSKITSVLSSLARRSATASGAIRRSTHLSVFAPHSTGDCSFATDSKPTKPAVQVHHHKGTPANNYVKAEEDIAALQRQIRDAYKYVFCVCLCRAISYYGVFF